MKTIKVVAAIIRKEDVCIARPLHIINTNLPTSAVLFSKSQ